MVHCTNLAIQTLNGLKLVGKIKSWLASMYKYFDHNPKHYLEIYKLAELLQCKGNKILKNIKTQRISMLSSSEAMLNEYWTLVVKMVENNVNIIIVKTNNHEFLCNVKTLLGLTCVFLVLKLMQELSTFEQGCDIFICDFVFVFKLHEVDLYGLYYDPKKRCPFSHFGVFIDLVEHIHN